MDAGIKTVESLLHGSSVFRVPHFQRSYSWGPKQWMRLWSDLLSLIEDRSERKHFIGPLVCAPLPQVPGDNLTQFEVIDGQQRLATLSTLFGAVRDAARSGGEKELADQLNEDYLIHHRRRDPLRFKLVPRSTDLAIWRRLIEQEGIQTSDESAIDDAWHWFREQAGNLFLRDGANGLRNLVHVASQRIAFVAITINDENPYRVFESLNSTGLALTEFDLVRNHLFMRVPIDDQEEFELHVWRIFEQLWDDCRRTDGSAAKEATSFLRQFLMRKSGRFNKGETFMRFREWADSSGMNPTEIVRSLEKSARFARHFRDIEKIRDQRNDPKETVAWPTDLMDQRLLQLAYCDARTTMPLLLELMDRNDTGELSREELLECLRDLVSLLVRRSLSGEKTKQYDKHFVEIARRLEVPIRETLNNEFQRLGWPSNSSVMAALVNFQIYRSESGKTRLILEELERSHAHKEPVSLARLQIEHVLPQTLSGESGKIWKQALGTEWREEHSRLVHTLGNLTLTGYNQTLSNQTFSDKRAKLRNSNLELNREILERRVWNQNAIEARTVSLGEKFLSLFPVFGKPPERTSEGRVDRSQKADSNRDFWTKLLDALSERVGEPSPSSPSGKSNQIIASEYKCCRLVAFRSPQVLSLRASFVGSDGDRIFNILRSQRVEIGREAGCVYIERLRERSGAPHFRIETSRVGFKITDDQGVELNWLLENILKFKSILEPRLKQLGCKPSGNKSRRHILRMAWFTSLLHDASLRTSLHAHCSPKKYSWVSAACGIGGLSYIYVVLKNESRAEFYFWSSVSNPTRSKQRYAWFLQRKKQIEAEVGPLNWEELKEKNACRISLSCPGGYMTEQKQWPEIHARLIEMMMKLHAALQPLIDSGEVERI